MLGKGRIHYEICIYQCIINTDSISVSVQFFCLLNMTPAWRGLYFAPQIFKFYICSTRVEMVEDEDILPDTLEVSAS